MFRSTANKPAGGGSHSAGASAATSSASLNKHQQPNATTNDNAPSTIREIRSRTSHSTTSSNARQLIANRRQAMSMERLNSNNTTHSASSTTATSSTSSASMHNINSLNDKEKNSPISGSSNSINGSTASSPSRGSNASSQGGLNRTASRVSRFRSAKAVFERLSSANSASGKPIDRSSVAERPKGTVASRYAAAAAARGIAAHNNANDNSNNSSTATTTTTSGSSLTSPRSRIASKNSVRPSNLDSNQNKSTMNNGVTRSPPGATKGSISARHDTSAHPKPQPRVITTTRRTAPVSATTGQNSQPPIHDTQTTNRNRPGFGSSSVPSKSQPSQPSQAKPPPKDLLDKIVLEIARNADEEHDVNCTIQDLSNCDISGIPETLDFDKCFQDVEMMTEEEARKLLSRKSESNTCSTFVGTNRTEAPSLSQDTTTDCSTEKAQELEDISPLQQASNSIVANVGHTKDVDSKPGANLDQSGKSTDSLIPPILTANNAKFKVRFSDEPVAVYDTHAIEDYDRRNDDIDPVAASAEYEIEKSRERDGMKDSDDEEEREEDTIAERIDLSKHSNVNSSSDVVSGAVILSEKFTQSTSTGHAKHDHASSGHHQTVKTLDDGHSHHNQFDGVAHHHNGHLQSNDDCRHDSSGNARAAANPAQPLSVDQRDAADKVEANRGANNDDNGDGDDSDDEKVSLKKDYIEFLEQEVNLKRILEQNLRDLQSQYYETVKQLDAYKGSAETKVSQLEASVADLNNRCETSQNELSDEREKAISLNKELNDIKESSQLLEKKYHRAKRIIKDMQAREESFTRREQLYQQKLDEIEYELGVLISTIDKTIYDDGLKYFSITDTNCLGQQHQTKLDVFGLIRQMLNNFDGSQSTQSEQIKQRIVSMLEQQLANLLALSKGATSVSGSIVPISSKNLPAGNNNVPGDTINIPLSSISTNNNDTTKHNQNYNYASHRLSQPNMPHPIGVGGQPTKIFHGLTPIPIPATLNEPSPPQSVNSYPSTNSLNSLNNNNNSLQVVNNNNNNNNNNNPTAKLRDQSSAGKLHQPLLNSIIPTPSKINTTSTSSGDDNFQPATDIQVPYQTNEWHDKPVSEWTTNQVSTWLLALGLDQYISKFEDRNVNGQSLINLDSTVLKGLGVLNSNDRNLLKKKIRELRSEMEKERKLMEKKMKENLKDKSKTQVPNHSKQSWKKSLLS